MFHYNWTKASVLIQHDSDTNNLQTRGKLDLQEGDRNFYCFTGNFSFPHFFLNPPMAIQHLPLMRMAGYGPATERLSANSFWAFGSYFSVIIQSLLHLTCLPSGIAELFFY